MMVSLSPPNPFRRRLIWTAVLVAALVLAAAAWWWPLSPYPARPRPRLDVLLITIDTLRADAIGAYGNARAATPWIDRLAASGVRFADAHAHNVTTLPSHANILSGRYPTDHGIRDNAGFRFPADVETLATLLKAQGYRTGAFVSAFPLASRFGLGRGFDVYDDSFVDAQTRPAFLEQERRGTETVSLARRWIDAATSDAAANRSDQPFFCWVHIYEPHFPYSPPEPFASRFRINRYLGEVAAADAALAPLVESIVSQQRSRRTLVVLTADHGESLGAHGEATHGIFAYEETLRVPLIVFQPDLFTPHVSFAPARHVDLVPTILDALSVPVPDGLAGRSLLPLARSNTEARPADSEEPIYFEALSGSLNRGWAPLRGVIRKRLKYIELPIPELYDLERDSSEAHNLASAEPRQMGRMRSLLAGFRGRASGGQDRRAESMETRQRLRSLGYVTAAESPAAISHSEDDPKRLIELDNQLQEVARLYLGGDLGAALARCRELVRRRPTMAVSLLELAHLERESGNMPQAIEALKKAAALNSEDTQTISLLGAYLTQAGRAREAIDVLDRHGRREQPDLQVLISLGLALAAAGRHDEALSTLARARAQEPLNAMLRVETGTVYLMAGDREGARTEFEAALALNPSVARAHSSLGVVAAESGHTREAIEHWEQAVTLDSTELAKLAAFGEFLRKAGREQEARPFLELYAKLNR